MSTMTFRCAAADLPSSPGRRQEFIRRFRDAADFDYQRGRLSFGPAVRVDHGTDHPTSRAAPRLRRAGTVGALIITATVASYTPGADHNADGIRDISE
ncbi:hypothetical protein AB0C34_24710 [Nocardia sp. NPDC049220]|uniref:hypothetical protein n=1 Tax=Nocardia sp. NPDC049220 TaxID=3155273 RepID=UPI0033E62865